MLNLIKLELRKNKLSTYIWASLFIGIGVLGFSFLFGIIPKIMIAEGDIPTELEMKMFTEWANLTTLISTLTMVCFAILSSVMYARFVISEYTGKALTLLFSYPIKRSKILLAKCILVFFFTFIMTIICNMLTIGLYGFISNIFNFIESPFTMEILFDVFLKSLVLGLIASAIGMLAMRIGFRKKSVPVTIVSAVALSSPCTNLFSYALDKSFALMLGVMLILLIISFISYLMLAKRLRFMEVL